MSVKIIFFKLKIITESLEKENFNVIDDIALMNDRYGKSTTKCNRKQQTNE